VQSTDRFGKDTILGLAVGGLRPRLRPSRCNFPQVSTAMISRSDHGRKRTTHRNRVFKAGTIEFGGSAMDCTIRNVSINGAALEVASPVGIPEKFTLVLPSDGPHSSCRVVWRKERRIGVVFE
jgi:hypothetical protein